MKSAWRDAIKTINRDMAGEDIRQLVGDAPFIIEVGANNGKSTEMFLQAMPRASVLCFEFDYRALEDFRAKQFSQRVRLKTVAISDRYETRRPWLSGGIPDCDNPKQKWHKSSSLQEPKEHLDRSPEIPFTVGEPVQCAPLDAYYDGMTLPVDFLWCDVQGSEPLVILGGQKTLRQTKYAIFEYYDRELYDRQADIRGLRSFLPDFDPIAIYGENVLFRNKTL